MAGDLTVNRVQLGDSTTAANNFVWQTNTDGTAKLARGNIGATTQDILTVAADGKVNFLEPIVAFSYSPSTATNIATTTPTKIVYSLLDFDTTNSVSNSVFTAPVAGFYHITGGVYIGAPIATGTTIVVSIYKNNSLWVSQIHTNGIAAYDSSQVTGIIQLAVGDTVDIRASHNVGSTINTTITATAKFQGILLAKV